jgi:heme exporter protein D
MFELGPHASFIVAAYGVTLVALAGLVLGTVGDDLKQRRLLAALERQGIRRRSAAKPAAKAKTPRTAAKKPAKTASKTKPARSAKRKTPS